MRFDVQIVYKDGTTDWHWCVSAEEVGRLSDKAEENEAKCYVYSAC